MLRASRDPAHAQKQRHADHFRAALPQWDTKRRDSR
jgi:hypothetical protein